MNFLNMEKKKEKEKNRKYGRFLVFQLLTDILHMQDFPKDRAKTWTMC